MPDSMTAAPGTRIYRLKTRHLIFNILNIVLFLLVASVPLLLIRGMLKSTLQTTNKPELAYFAFACALVPLLIPLSLGLFQVIFNTITSFRAYIRVTPEGIEQRNFPYLQVRARWADVERLGKIYLFYDALYLNNFEKLGLSLSLMAPFNLLSPKPGFIPLSTYSGWPNGPLADEIRQYAPALFQTFEHETYKEQKPLTAPASQEERVLAALAHLAVLVSGMGLLLPLILYALQKDRSSYAARQSLQAFVWQVGATLFNLLTYILIIGAVFVPILLASPAAGDSEVVLSGGGLAFLLTAAAAIILSKAFFIIYGLAGAFRAYQGKAFQYILVSRLLGWGTGAGTQFQANEPDN